jgi:hypothetical protein
MEKFNDWEKELEVIGYRVVVLSGSCSTETIDFHHAVGRIHETKCDCGHVHKTEKAAGQCLQNLLNYNKKTRSCSAKWYNGRVAPVYKGYPDVYLELTFKQTAEIQ